MVPDAGRRITVYRGQKVWRSRMSITASSMRISAGSRANRATWTEALLTQFKRNISGAVGGDHTATKRLEGMLINAQQFAFQSPFVSTSLSYSVARGFANAGDTPGFVLTIVGPWYSGIDFEFLRNLLGLYGGAFDYLQEFGLPARLASPFTLVKVDRVEH